ncbi:MAG: ABC transporter permease, partial [Pseudomonadota bacterium]
MMYMLLESLRAALAAIIAHKLRSFLTTLGIIIGTAAVVAVISLTEAMSNAISAEFENLGTNSMSVNSRTPFRERLKGRISRITPEDLQLIQERVEGVDSITPVLSAQTARGGEVNYDSRTTFAQLMGTTYRYQDVNNVYATVGRFLSKADDNKRRRVCVIGEKTREDLELPVNPVGEYIEASGEWLKIVGVMEVRGELFGFSQDNYVIVPYRTLESMNGAQRRSDIRIQLTAKNAEDLPKIEQRIRVLLRRSHGLSVDQDDDFRIETPQQIAESFDQIITTVTAIVTGIIG